MTMSSPTNRPTVYISLLIFSCFVFVCIYGIPRVERHSAFNLGTDVNLTCKNRTWGETLDLYVVWRIRMRNRRCSFVYKHGSTRGACNDGKSFPYDPSAPSILHIPNISNDDVGIYTCEMTHRGRHERNVINVTILASPSTSSWLEHWDNRMLAVCKAERGIPAAVISWRREGGSPSPSEETLQDPDGFYTVESRLELLQGRDAESLSCAISHPYWTEEKVLAMPKLNKDHSVPWLHIAMFLLVFLHITGLLVFSLKKLMSRKRPRSDNN